MGKLDQNSSSLDAFIKEAIEKAITEMAGSEMDAICLGQPKNTEFI